MRGWRPPVEETGPGLRYDPCPRPLCDGWGHRIDQRRTPIVVVGVQAREIQSAYVGEAVYRCETCGEEWAHPVDVEVHQPALIGTLGSERFAFDEAATIAAWAEGDR